MRLNIVSSFLISFLDLPISTRTKTFIRYAREKNREKREKLRERANKFQEKVTTNYLKKRLYYKKRIPSILLHKSEQLIEILAYLKFPLKSLF